jgi:hypothetical protein
MTEIFERPKQGKLYLMLILRPNIPVSVVCHA